VTQGKVPTAAQQPPPSTREALLQQLLHTKPEGLTLDELAALLGVTRNAVRQQVTALERDGLVAPIGLRPSGRRPSRTYGMTERGRETFPRRYDMLSLGMLRALRDRLGDETAESVLATMADDLAAELLPALERLDAPSRRAAVIEKMNELGYHARLAADGESIEAINCIYHRVAQETRAVCRFDERLISLLLGTEVRLTSCMADGEGSCAFAALASLDEARPS
jgi:predicted ArsR family transcriptional regulator